MRHICTSLDSARGSSDRIDAMSDPREPSDPESTGTPPRRPRSRHRASRHPLSRHRRAVIAGAPPFPGAPPAVPSAPPTPPAPSAPSAPSFAPPTAPLPPASSSLPPIQTPPAAPSYGPPSGGASSPALTDRRPSTAPRHPPARRPRRRRTDRPMIGPDACRRHRPRAASPTPRPTRPARFRRAARAAGWES